VAVDLFNPDPELVKYFASHYRDFHDGGRRSPTSMAARQKIQDNSLLFTENCLWISNKDADNQRLVLNPAQMMLWDLWDEIDDGDRPVCIVILKARQEGLSTAVAARLFMKIITSHNVRAKVMAHRKDSSSHIFNMYGLFYDMLFHGIDEDLRATYESFKPTKGIGNRVDQRLVFQEGRDKARGLNSDIEVIVPVEAMKDGSGSVGRGMTAHHLHISELDDWANPGASLSSVLNAFTERPGATCIIEATGRKSGGYFHKTWEKAHEPGSMFHPLFIPWATLPEYSRPFFDEFARVEFEESLHQAADDPYGNEGYLLETHDLSLEQLNWRRATLRSPRFNGSIRLFQSEYPITPQEAFESAHGNYIDATKTHHFLGNVVEPRKTGYFRPLGITGLPELDEHMPQKFVKIFEPPEPHAEYILSADVAEDEVARDYSCGVMLRRLPMEVVATIRGNDTHRPLEDEFATQLALLGQFYGNAHLVVERNTLGRSIIERLVNKHRYPKMVMESDLRGELRNVEVERYGVATTRANRTIMLADLRILFEEEIFECPDEILVREVLSLQPDINGKVAAPMKGRPRPRQEPEAGYYDDMAMALAIAYHVHSNPWFPKAKTIKETRQLTRERRQERDRREASSGSRKISFV
jgi:hypothetical protein